MIFLPFSCVDDFFFLLLRLLWSFVYSSSSCLLGRIFRMMDYDYLLYYQ